MAGSITYRELSTAELPQMVDIDRAETIDGFYACTDGQLSFNEEHKEVRGWYPTEIPAFVENIGALIGSGGAAFGAFDGDLLVGIVGLSIEPVGGDPTVMQLEPLQVSKPYRKQGIGKRLTLLAAERARSLGAKSLYISATPNRNTIDAYLGMGASLLTTPDPVLFEKEPEDIHLILEVDQV
jgi:GNAT superfamily N-acetyltransferase